MRTIEHEGQTYILKSSMEEIIRERVAKVATRANEAEQAAKDLQERLQEAEKKTSSADILASRVEQLQAELDSSKSRYERYQAISKHGLVDEDMVEAVEWSYERSQRDVAKKDRKSLGEWLEEQVANPDQAHALLRPHLHSLAQEQAAPIQGEEAPPLEVEAAAPPPSMPAVNNGAVRPPSQAGDIIDLGLQDRDFYKQNRDKIEAAWRARNSRR